MDGVIDYAYGLFYFFALTIMYLLFFIIKDKFAFYNGILSGIM